MKEIGRPAQVAEVAAEAQLDGAALKMPLAGHQRRIAGLAQRLGDRHAASQVHPGLGEVAPGQQHASRLRTLGPIVELAETQT